MNFQSLEEDNRFSQTHTLNVTAQHGPRPAFSIIYTSSSAHTPSLSLYNFYNVQPASHSVDSIYVQRSSLPKHDFPKDRGEVLYAGSYLGGIAADQIEPCTRDTNPDALTIDSWLLFQDSVHGSQ